VGLGFEDADTDYVAIEDEPGERWRGCFADVYALADDDERQRAVELLGRPVDIAKDALERDLNPWVEWHSQITALAEESRDEGEFLARLEEWSTKSREDEDIASGLYRSTMQSDMAGQLFVRLVEVPEALPESLRELSERRRPSFLRLPFSEAIDAFLRRAIVSPAEFARLSDEAKTRALTATLLASGQVTERAARELRAALESGSTLADFARALREQELSLGILPSDPVYVENVFRTNMASAYGAGRYRQIRSPAVRAARPFVQYRTAGDARVRSSHARLRDLVFRQDDPEWPRYAPPNGFQCRCSVVTRASVPEGLRVTDAATLTVLPDEGFDTPPSVDFLPSS
jgi:SPP1 gp7 family putative phage head morphogenesis protein